MGAAQALALSDAEVARVQPVLAAARLLVNPSAGILGVTLGKSTDRPGEAAVIVYVNETMRVAAPDAVEGVRTEVISTNLRAVAFGSAPMANAGGRTGVVAAQLTQALNIKRQVVRDVMQQNPAFFGVGVGQSLDNPREAAFVIYVDSKRIPGQLPQTLDGLRTRYVVMDRLHVTRSYAAPFESRGHCMPHTASQRADGFVPASLLRPRSLKLF